MSSSKNSTGLQNVTVYQKPKSSPTEHSPNLSERKRSTRKHANRSNHNRHKRQLIVDCDAILAHMGHYPIRDDDAATWEHPVDIIEPQDDPPPLLAEALRHVVLWMNRSRNPSKVGARAMVLGQALDLDINGMITYADIAEASGLSREAVRQMARELEDRFGLRSYNSRSDETRRKCSAARQSYLNLGKSPQNDQ